MNDVRLSDVAWRGVDDGTLVVHRTSPALWHLNPAATAAWPMLSMPAGSSSADECFAAIAATLRAAGRAGRPAPRIRRVLDLGDVITPIELARDGFVRHVGVGVLWCAPDGRVSMFTNEAAAVWDRLALGSAPFTTLCDLIGDRFNVEDEAAERRTAAALEQLGRAGAIAGLEQLARFRAGAIAATGLLGVLSPMQPSETPRGSFAGVSPVLAALPFAHSPAHVAVVCQYGIAGLAPGVDDYVQSCVRRLEQLNPDLVILSGGGRHGLSAVREAESVIDRYRAQLPGRAIWVDRHSETTWENLQHSLEMLAAASIVPRRVSFIGDRARTEKLRLCCWLAKQRFPQFKSLTFRVVPLRRARFTWRDRRGAQLIAGCIQAFRDYRSSSLSVRSHA
jgi:hypothetical protein